MLRCIGLVLILSVLALPFAIRAQEYIEAADLTDDQLE